MTRNRQRGKDLERFVAKDLGGRRVGILGQEDVRLWCGFSCETKERQVLPAFISRCMAQAERNAGADIAVVILHELSREHEDDVVMLRYRDFKRIIKSINKEDK